MSGEPGPKKQRRAKTKAEVARQYVQKRKQAAENFEKNKERRHSSESQAAKREGVREYYEGESEQIVKEFNSEHAAGTYAVLEMQLLALRSGKLLGMPLSVGAWIELSEKYLNRVLGRAPQHIRFEGSIAHAIAALNIDPSVAAGLSFDPKRHGEFAPEPVGLPPALSGRLVDVPGGGAAGDSGADGAGGEPQVEDGPPATGAVGPSGT